MTDQPIQPVQPADPTEAAPGQQPGYAMSPAPPAYQPVAQGPGPLGKIRGTGVCMLLTVVTFGIYAIVWYYNVHSEMKRHTGRGLGGGIAVLIGIFVGIAMPYLTSGEVGGMYELRGQRKPVSGATGLWYFPGMFLIVGPIVWFVKTNGALNAYWRNCGVR